LVDAADVIVNGLHAEQDPVVGRQRLMAPDTPVVRLEGADTSAGPARTGGGVVIPGVPVGGASYLPSAPGASLL